MHLEHKQKIEYFWNNKILNPMQTKQYEAELIFERRQYQKCKVQWTVKTYMCMYLCVCMSMYAEIFLINSYANNLKFYVPKKYTFTTSIILLLLLTSHYYHYC